MADNEAIKKLGDAARSGFGAPKKQVKTFSEAREGATAEMKSGFEQGASSAATRPSPKTKPSPAPSASPLLDDDILANGNPDEVSAALKRRKKSKTESYDAIQ